MQKNISEVFIGFILLMLGFFTLFWIFLKPWKERQRSFLLSQWKIMEYLWRFSFFFTRFNPYESETWKHINIFASQVMLFVFGVLFLVGGIVCFIDYFFGIPR